MNWTEQDLIPLGACTSLGGEICDGDVFCMIHPNLVFSTSPLRDCWVLKFIKYKTL